jgi:hypothetical protein
MRFKHCLFFVPLHHYSLSKPFHYMYYLCRCREAPSRYLVDVAAYSLVFCPLLIMSCSKVGVNPPTITVPRSSWCLYLWHSAHYASPSQTQKISSRQSLVLRSALKTFSPMLRHASYTHTTIHEHCARYVQQSVTQHHDVWHTLPHPFLIYPPSHAQLALSTSRAPATPPTIRSHYSTTHCPDPSAKPASKSPYFHAAKS